MRLLILYEKNFNRYFSVPTDKDLHKVCVMILKERLKLGWYEPDSKPEELAPEFLNTLPQGRLRTMLLEWQTKQNAEMVHWTKDCEFKEKVLQAIKIQAKNISWKDLTPYRVKAYNLLESRSRAEYERVELDKTEN